MLVQTKVYLKQVAQTEQAVKDGYCDNETFKKIISGMRASLDAETVAELKKMGVPC